MDLEAWAATSVSAGSECDGWPGVEASSGLSGAWMRLPVQHARKGVRSGGQGQEREIENAGRRDSYSVLFWWETYFNLCFDYNFDLNIMNLFKPVLYQCVPVEISIGGALSMVFML
jgi:hypothetical protein